MNMYMSFYTCIMYQYSYGMHEAQQESSKV